MEHARQVPTAANDPNIDPALAALVMNIGGNMAESPTVTEDNAATAPNEEALTPTTATTPTTTGNRTGRQRELSNSKRAAQNRAAQRAFRTRKENKIKELEEGQKAHQLLRGEFDRVKVENDDLRAYIVILQSRLLEVCGEYPAPPPHLNLTPLSSVDPTLHASGSHPHHPIPTTQAPLAPMTPSAPMAPPAPPMGPPCSPTHPRTPFIHRPTSSSLDVSGGSQGTIS